MAESTHIYAVFPCVPPAYGVGEGQEHSVIVVEAGSEELAASKAHEVMFAEKPDTDPDYDEHVHVLQFDPRAAVAYHRGVPTFARAPDEFQCCGGPVRFTDDGHSGWCPDHPGEASAT